MNILFYKWYSLIISILLWIFIWNIFDVIFDELNLDNKHKLIFYSICLFIIIMFINYDKKFFKYA
jgi:hypothetical protein